MSTAVHALTAEAALLTWLDDAPSTLSRVHSVFDRAVNLVPHDGSPMWTLAAAGLGNAPATVLLDSPSLTGLALAEGDELRARPHTLTRADGTAVVDLDGVLAWTAVPPALPVPVSALAHLDDALDAHGIPGGALPASTGTVFEAAVAALLGRALIGLVTAIEHDDVDGIRTHATRLLGLGPGLTPAGDDALLGLTLVAALPGSRLAHARPVLATVIAGARARTTDVSVAALTHATRGRTREPLIDLLHTLVRDEPAEEITTRAQRVIAIGHTSGTDILTGLSAALHLDTALRGER